MRHYTDGQGNTFGFDDGVAIPEGLTEITVEEAREINAAWMAPQTPEEIQAAYIRAIDGHVEATARARQYNSAAHLASYDASTVPEWQAEALAFVAWRDAVWLHVIARFAAVQAGTEPPPESAEALIAALPQMVWP